MKKAKNTVHFDRITILLSILGIFGLIIFYLYYQTAFPTASIEFKITGKEALEKSEEYIKQLGFDLKDYKSCIYFNYNNGTKEFLEKKTGFKTACSIIKNSIPVWYWQARWFKPQNQEEYTVWIEPSGKITGFLRITPKDGQGAYLTKEKALTLAENFLKKQNGVKFEELELIKSEREEMSFRRDYTFLWKNKNLNIENSIYNYIITIQGDRIGLYGQYLKIPEDYLLGETKKGEIKNLLMLISSFFYFILFILCIITFISLLKKKKSTFKFAFYTGITWSVITIICKINSASLLWQEYSTEKTVISFFAEKFSMILLTTALSATGLIIASSTGKSLYKEISEKCQDLDHIFTLKYIKTKEFSITTICGYSAAFIHLGFVTLFYLLGEKYFNCWTPADISYREILSTPLPWLAPLTIGLSASFTEEIFFRLFAISFLKKYFKKDWLPIIIPSLIWAFLHSNYPQEPFYLRGIELFFVGILLSCIFLKYGIVTTIISHYVYNCLVDSLILITSQNMYFKISGIIVIAIAAIPALITAIGFKNNETKEEEQEKTYPLEKSEKNEQIEPVITPYEKLSKIKIYVLITAGIISLILSIAFKKPAFGDFINFSVTSWEIKEKADDYLKKTGQEPSSFWSTIDIAPNYGNDIIFYLTRNIGTERTNKLFEKELDYYSWRVRYFQPMKYEEIEIYVNTYGIINGYGKKTKEDEKGERPDQVEAKNIIQNFLKTYHNEVNINDYELRKQSFEDQKYRRDYTFNWKKKSIDICEATYELKMKLQGNKVATYFYYLHLPEIYVRKMAEKSTFVSLMELLESNLQTILIILLLIIFVIRVIKNKIPWNITIKISLLLFLIYLTNELNSTGLFFVDYKTSEEINLFIIRKIFTELISITGYLISIIILTGTASSFYMDIFGHNTIIKPSYLKARDFIVLTVPLIIVFYAFILTHDYIQEILFPLSFNPNLLFQSSFLNCFLPSVKIITEGILIASIIILILFILIGISIKTFKNPLFIILFCNIFLFLYIRPEVKTITEICFDLTFGNIFIFLIYFLITEFIKNNIYIYFITIFILYELLSVAPLLKSDSYFYLINGYIVIFVTAIPYIVTVFQLLKNNKNLIKSD